MKTPPAHLALALLLALLPGCLCLAADAGTDEARDHGIDATFAAMQRQLAACQPSEHTAHIAALLDHARQPATHNRIDLVALADLQTAFDGAVRDGVINLHERKALQHRFDALNPP